MVATAASAQLLENMPFPQMGIIGGAFAVCFLGLALILTRSHDKTVASQERTIDALIKALRKIED